MNLIRSLTVLVLLSIPAFELLMPGICAEDLQGVAASLTQCSQTHIPIAEGIVNTSQPEESHHGDHPIDDECFCCCQHVVPQLSFVLPDYELPVEITHTLLEDLLFPISDPPDHPPRDA